RAVTFDASGVKTVVSLATASEIMSLDSAALADGGAAVVLQVPSGTEDVDDFHVHKFLPNGTLDPDFDDPGLSDDEVGGPVHVVGLRTGEIAVAYNVGPDPAFAIRVVSPAGEEESSSVTSLDAWMYGIGAVTHDGSLIVAVDESPADSVEPDSLALVKVLSDDSGRFIDDDG